VLGTEVGVFIFFFIFFFIKGLRLAVFSIIELF